MDANDFHPEIRDVYDGSFDNILVAAQVASEIRVARKALAADALGPYYDRSIAATLSRNAARDELNRLGSSKADR